MRNKKIIAILASVTVGAGFVAMGTSNTTAQNNKSENTVLLTQNQSSNRAVVINGNGSLVLRATGNNTSSITGYISVGQMLTIKGESGNYYKVQVQETGATGYISNNNLQVIESGINSPFESLNGVGEIINVTNRVNLRQQPTMGSSVIATYTNNSALQILGKQGQWYKVSINGTVGFIYEEYVQCGNLINTTTSNNNSTSYTGYVHTAGAPLNIRISPNGSSSIIGTLPNSSKVEVIGISGHWTKVKVNGKTGYVNSKYINGNNSGINGTGIPQKPVNTPQKPETTPKPGNTPQKPEATVTYKYVKTKGANLNLRASASTNSKILGTLKNGTKVEVLGTTGNWTKVKVNGQVGYVNSQYLNGTTPIVTNPVGTTPQKPETAPKPGNTPQKPEATVTYKYVKTKGANLNLRASASTNSKILGTLKNGTKVEVLGTTGSWTKVKVNGQIGYVSSQYLTSTAPTVAPQQPETAVTYKYVKTGGINLNVRASESTNAKILTTLKNGSKVEVLGTTGSWTKVKVNGQIGYVSSQYLI